MDFTYPLSRTRARMLAIVILVLVLGQGYFSVSEDPRNSLLTFQRVSSTLALRLSIRRATQEEGYSWSIQVIPTGSPQFITVYIIIII